MTFPLPLEIDVPAAQHLIAAGARLLDVREAAERVHLRIAGASWIPISDLARRWPEVAGAGAVVVHCSAGSRSFRSAKFLREKGIAATALVGGLSAWLEAGAPVVSGPLVEVELTSR